MISIKFRKAFKRWDCQCYKFHRITHKTIFWTFGLHKNIFITLKYSGIILEMISKQTFMECSSDILETLLCDYWKLPKDQHLLLSHDTLLTQKQLFHRELFRNSFSLKCFLNVPWMSSNIGTLREHSVNILAILRAGWDVYLIQEQLFFAHLE